MKNCFIVIVFLVSVSLLNSCGGKSKPAGTENGAGSEMLVPKERKITAVNVLYYNYIFESADLVSPENMEIDIPLFEKDKNGILDAEITDSLKTEELQRLLKNLKPASEQTPADARITATVIYNDGTQDRVCIGGVYTNRIYLNGREQAPDNEFLFTLKNYIGFYPWMIGDDMFKMVELQDNSFPKPPFISGRHYKTYQAALSDNANP